MTDAEMWEGEGVFSTDEIFHLFCILEAFLVLSPIRQVSHKCKIKQYITYIEKLAPNMHFRRLQCTLYHFLPCFSNPVVLCFCCFASRSVHLWNCKRQRSQKFPSYRSFTQDTIWLFVANPQQLGMAIRLRVRSELPIRAWFERVSCTGIGLGLGLA